MKTKHIDLVWTAGYTRDPADSPEKFIPSIVPGAVQLDWARACGWPEPYYASNIDDYLWMEDVYWVYRTTLQIPTLSAGQRCRFVSRGIDYRFRILLNGRVIHEQEGMFTPVDIDLTGIAVTGDCLEVMLYPVPKSSPTQSNHQPDQSCKPAVSYGWDFHPRLVPSGIWDDTYLEITGTHHIRSAETHYRLSPLLDKAHVWCDVRTGCSGPCILVWKLLDSNGNAVVQRNEPVTHPHAVLDADLDNPRLWWPNGEGEPVLYTSELSMHDPVNDTVLDIHRSRIGFRKVKLIMATGQWDDPDVNVIPKGPNKPPITMEINGRQIFCKGSNWVSPDIFPGRITASVYEKLLELARDANFNILRCWGGAPVQKNSFFDKCDELGLMVWQEFPLACNRYEGSEHYLKILDQESKSIIRRLRYHASVVLWCGGNELFNPWSRMTEQDHALRLLNRNCYDLDRDRPFIMTSPLFGMGHGHYLFRFEDKDVYEAFTRARCTAYTEYGVPSPAPIETLRRIIPENELLTPRESTAWHKRHGIGAWDGSPQSWLEIDCIEHYFGTAHSIEDLVHNGQLLQQEGLKVIFEEARRQKPRCAMALNWCFCEPWPTAANNSIVAWPDIPKPAHASVAAACRPVLASARIPKFAWTSGESFSFELWLLNDSPATVGTVRIEAIMEWDDQIRQLAVWECAGATPGMNVPGPAVTAELPVYKGLFRLRLNCAGDSGLASEYILLCT